MTENELRTSRRNFLIYTLRTVRTIAAGALAAEVNALFPSKNTDTMPHDQLPVHTLLNETATTTTKQGKTDTFTPEYGFTPELEKQVKLATVKIVGQGNDAKKNTFAFQASGWIAKATNSAVYIVTNRHVAFVEPNVTSFSFGRPNIDEQLFTPDSFTRQASDVYDLAILRCQGKFDPNTPFGILPWLDKYIPAIGQNALAVGFSAEFTGNPTITEAEYLFVDYVDSKTGMTETSGLENHGASGSPVVIPIEKCPLVIGTVARIQASQMLQNVDGSYQKQTATFFTALDVGNLIKKIDSN